MRNAFAAAITALAVKDERIVLLSGDIGNRLFDKYRERCPSRFYNCGVAEANMTGMAAGLALSGLRPFTYTITPFATTRVIEQIRIDICYHEVPVVIIGTGSGLSYASLGPTHHSCEDVGILRCFPNLTILCPADAMEVGPAIEAAIEAGADDCQSGDQAHDVYCASDGLNEVREALEKRFGPPSVAKLVWRPQSTVPVEGDAAQSLVKLLEALDDHDDIQNVYANFEMSDETLAKLAG